MAGGVAGGKHNAVRQLGARMNIHLTRLASTQAFIVSLYPARRLATPEEMAKSVLYLASDASSFTTGSALLVDGGVSINRT
jgi:NAD(P)-dependent dehydrogenase (short-subunit alcohol dehydrogenase family)